MCFSCPTACLYIVFELTSSVISDTPNNAGKSRQKPKPGKTRQNLAKPGKGVELCARKRTSEEQTKVSSYVFKRAQDGVEVQGWLTLTLELFLAAEDHVVDVGFRVGKLHWGLIRSYRFVTKIYGRAYSFY